MWLVSSRKDEGLIEHVQYEYYHCNLFLLEEISHFATAPCWNCPHSSLKDFKALTLLEEDMYIVSK